ncbi:hypothetical protein [Halioxenophilus sp. WMMB6]|uniref:hypothetical protein n=1 Tax=Halioxenophilus sp. WMMB6 TaxID=3073815 RepID=UPI00295E3D38|nr:hypothetical protein [Halioxenophilus sp. WMMB6]
MKNKFLCIALLLLFSDLCNASGLNVTYAPYAKVNGDKDEGGLFPDNYDEYNLDRGVAASVELNLGEGNHWYVEYTVTDVDESEMKLPEDQYSSLVVGLRQEDQHQINNTLSSYVGMSLGVGAARFNLQSEKYRALGEMKVDAGVIINQSVVIGPGIKFQIVGYPTETMAKATFVYFRVGYKF